MDLITWLGIMLADLSKFGGVLALMAIIATVLQAVLRKRGASEVTIERLLKSLGLLAFVVFVVLHGIFGIAIPPVIDEVARLLAEILAALLGAGLLIDRFSGTQLTVKVVALLKR